MKSKKLFLIPLLILVILFSVACNKTEVFNDSVIETQEPEKVQEVEEAEPIAENKKTEKTEVAETKPPEVVEKIHEEAHEESAEPEGAVITSENENLCTLYVHCKAVTEDEEASEGRSFLPSDGVIFMGDAVEFYEGESVFDILLRELTENKIHMEFSKNPMYKSAYIEGICNLYEFDCGDCSGWMYKVNGESPRVGCSEYYVKKNDKIEFYYSLNFMNEE